MFFFFFDKADPDYEQLLLLNNLIERFEYELVEFKEANNDFNKNKIGQYFSAISNEANLNNQQFGWLIFGVKNNDKEIVGTEYRNNSGLDKLKQEIAYCSTENITFIDIIELYPITKKGEKKRVIMFKIPAAATGIPTAWKGHCYGRNGESLTPLSFEKQDRIRGQHRKDWSKKIIEGTSIECLDKEAIAVARQNYKRKINKQHISEEVDIMSDKEFLTKLKLIIDGKITNAAMVLLGNSEYDHLMDTPPQVMWRLYGSKGEDKDYELFTIPYITVVDKVYAKIRNLTYRYMPNQLTLFSMEVAQYDQSLLKELLNNCIAHSDYTTGGRIYTNEFEDKIKITNPGTFLPGRIEVVLEPSYSPPYYRNQLLAETMAKLSMIDTASMGIRKIFNIQRERFFPMPDYDLSRFGEVAVTVYGKVLDENYTRLLHDNKDFGLETVFLIDKVQKNIVIDKDQLKFLRKLGVIEGKLPNIYISAAVATIVDGKEQYIKNKGFDDNYYKDLIIDYIKKFGKASKNDIRKLIIDKLPDLLSPEQKENKIKNILYTMSKTGDIDRDSDNQRASNWILTNKHQLSKKLN